MAYVLVLEGANENPLLDSRFPDVSSKGRGYQLQAYADGVETWPELRKVSIWQTVDALEQEFRERAAQVAQAKSTLGVDAAEAHRLVSSLADEIDDFEKPDSKEGSDDRAQEALCHGAGSKELQSTAIVPASAKLVAAENTPVKAEPQERKAEDSLSASGVHDNYSSQFEDVLMLRICL